jgi:hypothetical protein
MKTMAKLPTTVRVTIYAAAPVLALGVTLGSASVASAERVWDIKDFDSCSKMYIPPDTGESVESYTEHLRYCCWKSGGDWAGTNTGCVAPPAESQGLPSGPRVVDPAPVEDQVAAGVPKPRPTLPNSGSGVG